MSGLELHYSDGGHGGPYPNIEEAVAGAYRYLRGNPRRFVSVVIRQGVAGEQVATVRKAAGIISEHLGSTSVR